MHLGSLLEQTEHVGEAHHRLHPAPELRARLRLTGRRIAPIMERVRQLEDHTEGLWRIEVVVHRRFEAVPERSPRAGRLRRGTVARLDPEHTGVDTKPPEALERARRLAHAVLGELHGVAIVRPQQPEADRLRIVTLRELLDRERITEGL